MHAAPSLRELQQQFIAALYDPAELGPLAGIAGNGLEAEARLQIYRRSCEAMQTAALRTTYPAVLALVGDSFFDQTARSYRHIHPSTSGNLQAFGETFAAYLQTLPACRSLAYLPDVARLEWLRQQSVLAADVESVASEAFAESPGAARQPLGIALHPSVHLLASHHAILTIWGYAMEPKPERLMLDGEGENVVVWREDGEVAMAALDPASFACIAALARGCPLDDARRSAIALDPDFDLAACVESLLERRLITGIRAVGRGPSTCR